MGIQAGIPYSNEKYNAGMIIIMDPDLSKHDFIKAWLEKSRYQ